MIKRLVRYGAVVALVAMTVVAVPLAKAENVERVLPPSKEVVQYSYAPLIKRVAPAVVNIYTTRMVQTGGSMLFNDPFFRHFFGDRFSFGNGPSEQRQQNSLGSGVIVKSDGVIVTNSHVIQGADEIVVVLTDRREFKAKVVLSDPRTDLAVLRIDTHGETLPYLKFHDSDAIEVGDIVFAIGNPFGVGQTVTSGIVSAVARTQLGISDYEFFIQTDAAINPGNSGGALVGLDGTLYGINTMIMSRSGGSQGVGFAIPANMVARVVSDALTQGKVVRAWLGASDQAVTSELADSLGLDRPVGALVNRVYKNGPADRAGLKSGDVILKLDDKEVTGPRSLESRLATLDIGAKTPIVVLRDGKKQTLQFPVEAPPEVPKRDKTTLKGNNIFDGATVANLSPALADELRIDPMETGVIILSVDPQGNAAQIGFRPGDIFVSINDKPVKSVARLDAYWSNYSGTLKVSIRRDGRILSDTFQQ